MSKFLVVQLYKFLFGMLTIFSSCNGQDSPRSADRILMNQDSIQADQKSAIGDTIEELGQNVFYIFQSRNNSYWFGSDGQGVYYLDAGRSKGQRKNLIHFTTKDGLCNDRIRGIQEDKSGNIYFNTVTGAISKFNGRSFTTLNIDKTYATGQGWKSEPGDLWFQGAQDSGVVYRYDGI